MMKHPSDLEGLEYIGVDEVARAKGHDYVTVVYDLVSGDLLWVHEGRTAAVLGQFLSVLTENSQCNQGCSDGYGPAISVRGEVVAAQRRHRV